MESQIHIIIWIEHESLPEISKNVSQDIVMSFDGLILTSGLYIFKEMLYNILSLDN